MGIDKKNLLINGQPIIEHLFDLLEKICSRVVTSCRQDSPVKSKLNPMFDAVNYGGPINGILTAMNNFPQRNLLIITIDQPFITESQLVMLLNENHPEKDVTTFFNPISNKPEPFPSYWRSSAKQKLENFLFSNRPSPLDFLLTGITNTVICPDHRIFINLNQPEDLKNLDGISFSSENANS